MARIDVHSDFGSMPYSEKETIIQAQKVLGAIPEWFWENKEAIEKNRTKQHEWTHKLARDISKLVERFSALHQ